MSSETSTDTSGLQPWQFFVIVTMLSATAAVLVARESSVENLVLVSATVMAVGLVGMAVHRTLWPLTLPDDGLRPAGVRGRARLALEREKALVLRSIKELEFDRAMGKIGDTDFQEMSSRLRERAVGLMQQLDREQPTWRAEIEREVERRLAARGASRTPRAARSPAKVICSQCGTTNDIDARFCKQCGTGIAAGPDRPSASGPPSDG